MKMRKPIKPSPPAPLPEDESAAVLPTWQQKQYEKMDDAFRQAMVAAGYCARLPSEFVGGTMLSPAKNYRGNTVVLGTSALAQMIEAW